MPKFKVVANPKGGTCYQWVEANTEEEAIAKASPTKWMVARPRSIKDWTIKAFLR